MSKGNEWVRIAFLFNSSNKYNNFFLTIIRFKLIILSVFEIIHSIHYSCMGHHHYLLYL